MRHLIAVLSLLGLTVVKVQAAGLLACLGSSPGSLVPNPTDCGSYFVCSKSHYRNHLVRCTNGLHFDSKKKICNWPHLAKCERNHWPTIDTTTTQEPTTEVTNSTTETTIETSTTTTTLPPINTTETTSVNTTAEPSPRPTRRPGPVEFGAFDNLTGSSINPLDGYNPQNVLCIHSGIYFLPHPLKCNKYFLCAHRDMLQVSCGLGLSWNYRLNQCQVSSLSKCYYKESLRNSTTTTTTTERAPPSPSSTATTPGPTELATGNVTEPHSSTTPKYEGTTANTATIEIIAHQPDAPEDEVVLPNCEDGKRNFHPHPTDCRNYYICIKGTPILTSCSQDLYWNAKDEICSLAAYTECNGVLRH